MREFKKENTRSGDTLEPIFMFYFNEPFVVIRNLTLEIRKSLLNYFFPISKYKIIAEYDIINMGFKKEPRCKARLNVLHSITLPYVDNIQFYDKHGKIYTNTISPDNKTILCFFRYPVHPNWKIKFNISFNTNLTKEIVNVFPFSNCFIESGRIIHSTYPLKGEEIKCVESITLELIVNSLVLERDNPSNSTFFISVISGLLGAIILFGIRRKYVRCDP
jgi:hypothetical protein